jgi:ornithine cyclodeaminase/alanine dehydrogenase-like protein (mu-crystallin family)
VDEFRFVGRRAIEEVLTPTLARTAIGSVLAEAARPAVPRSSATLASGELLLMPAEGDQAIGVKVLTLANTRTNGLPVAQGVYLVFDARTLTPLAALDGATLTELRTAAVSSWAADVLANVSSATLTLFGSGLQARAHLVALAEVRALHRLLLVAQDDASAAGLLELAASLGLDACRSGPDAVAEADIVCCCTSSATPIFRGDVLREGTFVIAMGSHHRDRREVDTVTVQRSHVVVETRESALAEAGDLLIPISEGAFRPEQIECDLFELAAQGVTATARTDDLTLFKSVGVAFEDLAVACAALEAFRVFEHGAARMSRPGRSCLQGH